MRPLVTVAVMMVKWEWVLSHLRILLMTPIQRQVLEGQMSHHINAYNQHPLSVDAVGIGGRKKSLPGEVSECTSYYTEKSAEVIVDICAV